MNHIEIGQKGENIVINHLKRKGFKEVERNFRIKSGEIDLVAEKNGTVHFIEVKTVSREINNKKVSHETYRPEENVHREKITKILCSIQVWIAKNKFKGPWQLDVATVVLDIKHKRAKIKMIENIVLS